MQKVAGPSCHAAERSTYSFYYNPYFYYAVQQASGGRERDDTAAVIAGSPSLMALVLLRSSVWPVAAQTNERIYEDLDFRFVTPGAQGGRDGEDVHRPGRRCDGGREQSGRAVEPARAGVFVRVHGHKDQAPAVLSERRRRAPDLRRHRGHAVVLQLRDSRSARDRISVFINSVQDYRESFEIGARDIPSLGDFEDGSFGSLSAQVNSYGVGGAYVVNRYLSIGGSAMFQSLNMASEARSGTPFDPQKRDQHDRLRSRVERAGGRARQAHAEPRDRRDLQQGHGLRRRDATVRTTSCSRTRPPRRTRDDVNRTGEVREISYVVPDRYAAGVSWRALNSLTVLADVGYVKYSQQITDKFLIADFQDPAAGLTPDNYFIDDVFEFHAGAEWRWYGRRTFSLRGGVYTDPDHRLRFQSGGNDPTHPADPLSNFRFNTGRSTTDVGVTGGGGLTLFNRVQIDGAVSFSPDASQLVVSTVVRLP